ncbi:dipeptide/oligopeptide/nickel ABC transporter permease/ATP-binding protein [Nakamurella leprariae]|uniref:Dipeptide/oligopeptide/nickel ABC transporter permease/ATP-binding protein n=1 Tax=Nakamurella leprariae TaxID=2803911 RepID=A0A938YCU0_9ACTN|nr:dipeptide/oligopeptide/nickel ABC transporter permease/ATP-binding protein [Nakamurella leprariae]MBM9467479.1 dipeptide/oligopeptide/nickel ABC transporter permease/ATP-binding protein [Nakamurella leprariae]
MPETDSAGRATNDEVAQMNVAIGNLGPTPPGAEPVPRRAEHGVLRRFLRSPKGMTASILLAVLVITALAAPLLAPYDPIKVVGPNLAPFGSEFTFGTDHLGRDVLSNLVYGAQSSLMVGLLAAAIAVAVGTVVGSAAGYFGGVVDGVLMRVTELMQIVPGIIIAIVVAALFRADLVTIILIIGLTSWTSEARIIRAQVLTLREREFVSAARVAGYSNARIVFSEILPNAFPPMLVQGAMSVGEAILAQAVLAYLGIGDLNNPSWGQMINAAQPYLEIAPMASILPGVAILLVVITFTLASDALNDAFNPRAVKFLSLVRRARRSPAVGPTVASTGSSTAIEATSGRATMGPDAALCARDIVLRMRATGRTVTAVDHVSLHVERGEIVGVVGESGSGKSSLARVIAHLLPIADIETLEGSVRIGDVELSSLRDDALRRARRGHIAMVFQDPLAFLNPTMTIGRQLEEALPGGLDTQTRSERVAELLTRVELDPTHSRRFPHEMSGGQRQRVMIAMALATEPVLLIADEPTTALDATVQANILRLLQRLRTEQHFGVLLISHDLALVATVCDRVYVMNQGRFVEGGPTSDVFTRPTHAYTRHLLESRPGRHLHEGAVAND